MTVFKFILRLFLLVIFNQTIASADTAYVWGANDSGELGNGTYQPIFPYGGDFSPEPVVNLANMVSSVSSGASTSLAIQNGALYGWGSNASRQIGNAYSSRVLLPVIVTGLTAGVTAASGGDFHNLAIQNGSLFGFGDNTYGELGDGSTAPSPLPSPVSGMSSGVTALAAGKYYSLAVKNGGAYGWGANWHGQLGNGTTINAVNPVPLIGLSTGVTAIAAGGSYTEAKAGGGPDGTYLSYGLALKDGGVYSWGYNAYGQLGNGTTVSSLAATGVTGLSDGVSAIAAGSSFNLAVRYGNVYAWGSNAYGDIGDGTTNSQLTPELIDPADLSNITSVAAGDLSSYALASNGSLWVWGDNFEGQLGLGASANAEYFTPQHLFAPSGYVFTSVSAQGDGDFVLATLAPIPEPTSLSFLAIASLGLLGRRRG